MAYIKIIYPNSGSGGGGIIQHNDLLGIQGGTSTERIHLSQSEYNQLITLFEDAIVHPTYIQPSNSLNIPNLFLEVGSLLSYPIVQTFIQNNAGTKISETIRRGGTILSTTNTYNIVDYPVPLGPTQFTGTVTYAQGDCLLNNFGDIDCTDRVEAGTITSPVKTLTGIYPVFYYKSTSPITPALMKEAIETEQAQKLVINSTGTISIPYNPNAQYLAVAYPQSSTTKTRWYVSPLSQGDIPGGVFSAATILNIDSFESYWFDEPYKIHVTPLLTNPSINIIELRNS